MSALPPKADIHCGNRNVRFGPEADTVTALFDHLVGARDELHKRLYFDLHQCRGSQI
jgi:hypothetical protein